MIISSVDWYTSSKTDISDLEKLKLKTKLKLQKLKPNILGKISSNINIENDLLPNEGK